MKKFIRTLKSLSERAAQFQETLQQVPPKVAEIRQAVSLTSGQLRQLQADVQMNVASLKAENPDRLVEALHEINGSHEVFQEAGYELGHVEMELSPVQRLIVHLDRARNVRDSILHSLANANRERRVTHALLNTIIQAEAVADRVDIQGQVYYRLVVHVGPVPSVRLGWMPEPAATASTELTTAPATATQPATPSQPASYGQGSFFHQSSTAPLQHTRAEPSAPKPAGETPPPKPPPAIAQPEVSTTPPAPTPPQHPAGKAWGQSALERFKQMPGASKYAHRNR